MNSEAQDRVDDNVDAGILDEPKKFDPKIVLRILWSMLRRRWLMLGIAFSLAIVGGAVGSGFSVEKVWRSSGLLLYTPPTVPESVDSIASSVSLNNVSGLATSRPVLQRVKDELELGFPITLLAQSLKIETSRNQSTIFFSLKWGSKDEANQILEQWVKVYPEYVTEVRQQIAHGMLSEVEEQVVAVKARQSAARERYRDFTRENKIVDFKQDLILLQTKVLGLETKLSQARRDEQTMNEQVQMLDDHVNSIRREEAAESKAASQFEAAEETLADNRRRQNRLRELITEERRVLEIKTQIDVKRREYERAKLLAEKELIPNSQFEKVRSELESLIAKITESQSITRWKHELEELDKLVVPKNKVNKKGSPIIQQILFKRLETQLGIAQQQKAQVEIEQEIGLVMRQISTFQRLRSELKTLEDDMENLGNERQGIETKAAILRQLASLGMVEFSVVSPVSSGDFPISSNRKKMFIAFVFVGLLLSGTSIAAFDVLLCGIIPPDVQVELTGLPIIDSKPKYRSPRSKIANSEGSEDDASAVRYSEFTRSFALQLRQRLPQPGTVVMIGSLNPAESLSELIRELAACFAARDERVLILDARPAPDGLGEFADLVDSREIMAQACDEADMGEHGLLGLRDWLTIRCDDITDIALPTMLPGVDCVLSGRSAGMEELATIRMSELMDHVRASYTITILVAPDSSQQTELQILAAHADGITMAFERAQNIHVSAGRSVRGLFAVHAPLMGAVGL